MPNRGGTKEDRSQGGTTEDIQTDMEQASTATLEMDEPPITAEEQLGISALQEAVNSLRSRRENLDKERDEIDRGLENLKGEIDELLGQRETAKRPYRKVVRPSISKRGRGGTNILLDILRQHKGKMASSDLARMGADEGLKSVHSSLQSLKNRRKSPKIELDDGFVTLVED